MVNPTHWIKRPEKPGFLGRYCLTSKAQNSSARLYYICNQYGNPPRWMGAERLGAELSHCVVGLQQLIRNVTNTASPLQAPFECFSDPQAGEKDGLMARGRGNLPKRHKNKRDSNLLNTTCWISKFYNF